MLQSPAKIRWYVAQPSSREDYGVAKAFHSNGQLAGLLTDMWLPWARHVALPGRLASLRRRYTPALRDATVYSRPLGGIHLRDLRARKGHDWDRWVRDGNAFSTWAASRLSKAGLDPRHGVFSYTGTALEVLQYARQRGAVAAIGQVDPGFVWHDIAQREADLWGCSVTQGYPSSAYRDRVRAEWDIADWMIVNSRFSKNCLIADGVDASRIVIAEPPVAQPKTAAVLSAAPNFHEPLRVLFVGTLSLAKGIQYLGQAAQRLASQGFTFTAVGHSALPDGFLQKQKWPISHIGHKSREELVKIYRDHHVLVFPTLCDGFGLVQTEAQAHGLPVIATTACGDVVQDEKTGFIVPPADSDAIADRLVQLRDTPGLLEAMSEQALVEVRRFTPERYARRLLAQITSHTAIGGDDK